MGYAFLNEKKIHGVFSKPVKIRATSATLHPLLFEEGAAVEIGQVSSRGSDIATYPVYLFEDIGYVTGNGKKWTHTSLDGTVTDGFASRKAAALALAEGFLQNWNTK